MTLVTLIIAITIFGVLVTVFSYVIIAKHGSEPLYVQSTQAYAIAQAGIEYGIRYAADNGYWAAGSPGITESFGNGSFTLVYTAATETDPSLLTSTGTVGVAERQIILHHFVGWVEGQAITTDPNDPAYATT
ncbi:MAG: hypothetical protein JRI65_04520 [Deltaproteobacteria bacterium]|nr:hypothetical protein [Deltaproteobacteria bacterium]